MPDQTTDPPSTQQTLTLREAVDLAVQHQNAGDLTQAESIYRQILEAHPDQPLALHFLGVIAHQRGESEQAVTLIEKALSINPTYAEAHLNLGVVFNDLGRSEEAIVSYQNALMNKIDAIDPLVAETYKNLAGVYFSLGKLEEAASNYGEGLKHMPPGKPYLPWFAYLGLPQRHYWMIGTIALFKKLDRPISILEVGSWLGSSLLTWGQSIKTFLPKGGKLLSVDPWVPYLGSGNLINENEGFLNMVAESQLAYSIFCHNANTMNYEVKHFRGTANTILPGLKNESFDLVFIDGNHNYDDVIYDISEGCRLVRDGGYICGDDLEIQWVNADQQQAKNNKNKIDYLQDSKGRYYHPGVTTGVYELLGDVTCREGYWIMQKQGAFFKKVKFEVFEDFIPDHFDFDWKEKYKDYVNTFNLSIDEHDT